MEEAERVSDAGGDGVEMGEEGVEARAVRPK